jgi:hypothetical protein
MGLTPMEARRALPDPAEFMVQPMDLPEAVTARIDAVAAVADRVDALFFEPSEREIWLHGQHQLSAISGRKPLALLTSGEAADLALLRTHLDFWLAGAETPGCEGVLRPA